MKRYRPEESLGRWISILDRCATRFARRRLGSYGIGKNHLFFLGTLLYEGDDVTQEELASRLHMDPGATTRSLLTLEQNGYLRRVADRQDARARRVRLTAKARRQWPRITEDLSAWNEALTRGFTKREQDLSVDLLRRMAQNAMESLEETPVLPPEKGSSRRRTKAGKALAVLLMLAAVLWPGSSFAGNATGRPALLSATEPASIVAAQSTDLRDLSSSSAPPSRSQGSSMAAVRPLLTLPSMLRIAAEQSLAAQAARYDSIGAEAGIHEAQAAWWPTITADASYTVKDNPVVGVFGDAHFPFAEKSSAAYGIELKQLLFNGGRRNLTVAAARQGAEATLAAGQAGIRDAQLQAMNTYLQILRINARREVLRQRHAAVSAHREVAEDLYGQGLVARNDLLETQVREREIEDAEKALTDAHKTAVSDLNRLLGRGVLEEVELPDSLGPPPELADSLDAFLAQADTLNPSLRAARARLEATRTKARLAGRAYWPEFYVAAGHSYEQNQYMAYPHVNAVVAAVNWKVFEGGARKAKIQEAEAEAAREQRVYEDGRRTVSVAVGVAWRQWRKSLREERTAGQNVEAAAANLQIVEDQYRSGLARSSDVLDAEALLAGSRFAVVRRHYESYWNQARLLATAGRDPAVFYADAARRGED